MALIQKYASWVLLPVAAILYYFFAFKIERTDHIFLFTGFGLLLLLSIGIYLRTRWQHWSLLFGIGLLFRLLFLFAQPHLSDDFYRFTWDGELIKDGYPVFGFVPSKFEKNVSHEDAPKYEGLLNAHSEAFPSGMNSKNYYSIYPAINQFIFYTAALMGQPNNGNLIVIRLWILLAEIISFFALRALLRNQQKEALLGIYWLHPLIIIELTGNLHLEALAIAFIVLAFYFALKNQMLATALSVALAIMTKLTPILLLGAFYKDRKFTQWFLLCAVSILLTIGLFRTVVDFETMGNFGGSVGLFFAWFNFNAGPYFLVRDVVLLISGVDISATISLVFPVVTVAIGAYIVFIKKTDAVTTLLLLFTTYFLFSPIVHPWYITVLIPLGILSQKIYPILWSCLIFGTYLAYGATFEHPLWWVHTEYTLVIVVLFLELRGTNTWIQKLQKNCFSVPKDLVK